MGNVTFVGESNPYGADPDYALYPDPPGCSGWRLCRVVLGLNADDYLARFERVNLVRGAWSLGEAIEAAKKLRAPHRILLGARVTQAHGLKFVPFAAASGPGWVGLIWPHPSGRCRLWTPSAITHARRGLMFLDPTP